MIANIKEKFSWIDLIPYVSFVVLLGVYSFSHLGIIASLVALLFLAISIMVAVYHAEEIAHNIGEGLGALVLALSVTVIEVGLILSLMSASGSEGSAIARDTVFAAVIIVCDGIVGLCLLLGGLKYKELGFQFRGASSLLMILISLSVFCFILPNYTTSVVGPFYNNSQLIFVSIVSVLLYLSLVIVQTRTHTYYFQSEREAALVEEPVEHEQISSRAVLIHFAALVVGLVTVIGLAKFIAPMIETGVTSVGAPKAVVGLLIATIVLLPEAITAVMAARANRLQTSLNLALGSGAASIALTIPVVSAFSIYNGQPLMLGLDPKSTVFLLLTFVVGILTLGNGKATALHGIVHIIIMFAFFAVTMIP